MTMKTGNSSYLSYDITTVQWITLRHKNRTTIHITFLQIHVLPLQMSVLKMCFLLGLFISNVIKSHCKGV